MITSILTVGSTPFGLNFITSTLSTDKAAIQGEKLSQTLQGNVIPTEDEVALLEQYSVSKCIGQLIVVSCFLACSEPFS